jgi:hypothetical protein
MTPNSLTCTCKGWEYRQTCKHSNAIEKAQASGATFGLPLQFRSLTDPRRVYTVAGETRATSREPARSTVTETS